MVVTPHVEGGRPALHREALEALEREAKGAAEAKKREADARAEKNPGGRLPKDPDLLRGVAKVKGEWSLICTTHNLLKLWRATEGEIAYATG
ncbi:MAG TPA: hypothetical protein DCZ01_08905 [Elusimicrobia bacterium]|nr:MAG: hypothetical protein A2X37_02365 [Elusimicrobia bacterium GWA2_66_18]OGR76244.1 MAG: hypothetical protein A2X40_11715 [Elusimicrobia bacterium GWC2_65_9]HAZ08621.1 hypothetical protein [Elusimicrobiota bacterium]